MSKEHKEALARGRAEGKIVREYLEALRASKPKRGRKRTTETIKRQLAEIEAQSPEASAVDELLLIQKRRDLEAELESMAKSVDLAALEDKFVEVARSYSDSKKISYASWRDVGVEPRVLKKAGITRGS